jgi:hypothetical protein
MAAGRLINRSLDDQGHRALVAEFLADGQGGVGGGAPR